MLWFRKLFERKNLGGVDVILRVSMETCDSADEQVSLTRVRDGLNRPSEFGEAE